MAKIQLYRKGNETKELITNGNWIPVRLNTDDVYALDLKAMETKEGMCQVEIGYGLGSKNFGMLPMKIDKEGIFLDVPDKYIHQGYKLEDVFFSFVKRRESQFGVGGTVVRVFIDFGLFDECKNME